MFSPSPPVDTRSIDDVTASATALVQAYTTDPTQPGSGWSPASGSPDLGSALISIFSQMAQYVIDRVNLFPGNAYLAFLNMIGVAPTPPQAAQAALTFSLSKGTATSVLVPAGTLVGATAAPGDTGPVTFETEQDLVVSPAVLTSVLSYQPSVDLYTDNTALAKGTSTGFYPVFVGTQAIEHGLYLSADAILTLPAGTAVTLTIALAAGASASAWEALSLAWSYWSAAAAAWQPLTLTSGTAASLTIGFSVPSDIGPTTVNGQTASFIRVELTSWPAPGSSIPAVASVALTTTPVTWSGLAPDAAASSGGSIDLTADFYPFGAEPQFNSAFYLASAAALSTPGATVALTVTLSAQRQALTTNDAPTVVWEVWTGSAWLAVGTSTKSSTSTGTTAYGFSDGTQAFTTNGVVTFTLPSNVAPTAVRGVASSWLRIRLLGADNYGLGIVLSSGTGGSLTATNDGYRPPILASISLAYTVTPSAAAAGITYNDLTYASALGAGSSGVVPFVRLPDVEPALYLGFDRPFDDQEVLIYLQVAPLSLSDLETLGDVSTPPTLEWEYAGASGWASLGLTDATGAFAESGLVSFVGPADFTSSNVLGQTLYWIRVRLHAGQPAAPPRAGLVLLNTVWASNTSTTRSEVMGSSTGTPSQTFSLQHTPVLAGQQIYVQEPSLPPAAQQAAIEAVEGSDAILIVPGVQGQPEQIWVRWHAVTDFYGSGPTDRDYQIDSDSGLVTFGDGIHGLAPPQGQQNVWAFFYQSGGGAVGNRAAATITQLKTAVASIGGVTNYEEASGGADTEPLTEVQALGPTLLRNGGRAVAAQDYEDLALEASSDVARAACIPPNFDPTAEDATPTEAPEAGQVTLLIVPYSDDMPPTPGLGLIRDLTTYFQGVIAPAVTLTITGPIWIQVSVGGMTVVPVSAEGSDALEAQVVAAITAFLHPLTGGFDGSGWTFGALPQPSDIYRLVMGVAGVNAVVGFTLATNPTPDLADPDVAPRILIYSGTHTVSITAPDAGG